MIVMSPTTMMTFSPQVVSLLLDRKANVEHRAKTGLTPLMEAASGGYTEVSHRSPHRPERTQTS